LSILTILSAGHRAGGFFMGEIEAFAIENDIIEPARLGNLPAATEHRDTGRVRPADGMAFGSPLRMAIGK